MKLKNKKTGEIVRSDYIAVSHDGIDDRYHSLAELNEKWEDAKEPLIKDEKIRKAVRAWAEACGDDCYYISSDYQMNDGSGYTIEFFNDPFKDMERRHYTIKELCGEEEE